MRPAARLHAEAPYNSFAMYSVSPTYDAFVFQAGTAVSISAAKYYSQ